MPDPHNNPGEAVTLARKLGSDGLPMERWQHIDPDAGQLLTDEHEVRTFVPADTARSLYEALNTLCMSISVKSVQAPDGRRIDVQDALARYERAVGE